jgi:hypothetical protein
MSYEPNKVPGEETEKEGDAMEDQTKDYVANESLKEVEEQQCDLVQVEKGLKETTQVLVEDFNKGLIDATTTLTGLQLVQYTREACTQGDPQACEKLKLIKRFLERTHKESLH